jgi:hypothetical protein
MSVDQCLLKLHQALRPISMQLCQKIAIVLQALKATATMNTHVNPPDLALFGSACEQIARGGSRLQLILTYLNVS